MEKKYLGKSDSFGNTNKSIYESESKYQFQQRKTGGNLNIFFELVEKNLFLGGARSFCSKRERSGWTKKEDKEPILHESHGNPVAALSEWSRLDVFSKSIIIIFL